MALLAAGDPSGGAARLPGGSVRGQGVGGVAAGPDRAAEEAGQQFQFGVGVVGATAWADTAWADTATAGGPAHATGGELVQHLRELARTLVGHLDHEEASALPPIGSVLTPADWRAFAAGMRRSQGLRGAAVYVPWILDGIAPAERQRFDPPACAGMVPAG